MFKAAAAAGAGEGLDLVLQVEFSMLHQATVEGEQKHRVANFPQTSSKPLTLDLWACHCLHLARSSFYTPESDEHGPRFLTGGPGAAPGGVASKNGWVYMRVQGGFNFL